MGMPGACNTGEASLLKGAVMTSPSEDYRLIPLTQGQFAKVDVLDFDRVLGLKWHAAYDPTTKSFYARHGFVIEGKRRGSISMHRFILGLTKGEGPIDHENHDTLDNRRSNIRLATVIQNSLNRRLRTDSMTGFKGVCFHRRRNKYQARITVSGKRVSLGYFDTAEDVHALYCEAATTHHGEFARTK